MPTSIKAFNLFNVNGMVAVVTGGGSGIGLMIAQALAANGASKVYLVGRDLEKLKRAATSPCPAQNVLIPLQGDITSKETLQAAAARVKADVGHVNLLVANAGIFGPSIPSVSSSSSSDGTTAAVSDVARALWDTPMEAITNTFHVNVTSVLYTTVAFLELLDAGNRAENRIDAKVTSQVVATSSTAGFSRRPSGLAYHTSKAATTHLMKCLSNYLVPFDIRCNVLAPGLIQSELAAPIIETQKIGTTMYGDRSVSQFERSFIPAQRVGDEEDIAGTILYLVSKAGSFCNGTVVMVDGGRLAVIPSTY